MTATPDAPPSRGHFITDIIDADRAAGWHGGAVVTRFPPEPNGYLHIGHAKAILLNFGLADRYGGRCHLRFDDTNPVTEDTEYVESIQEDVRWLGGDWGDHLYFGSDFFERMFEVAVRLIERGKAYVSDLGADAVRAGRGTPYEPGTPDPNRDRPAAESLDLFARMRAGEFADGAYILRARIDMASPNLVMRDPALYRIRHATHHRTGDAWCIYPMYDFAHCLEDAFEGVTHSICTLEFQDNRELYDWVIREGEVAHVPKQIEFARLGLAYTLMSKRKLRQLVEDGHVAGWDDPRMPTLAGLRRRGVTPDAIRAFADMIGVAKANSLVDIGKLEYCIRDDLNHRAPRHLAVLDPVELVVEGFGGGDEVLDAPLWPDDIGTPGTRALPFSARLWIERADFALEPPRKWRRMAPGRTIRLRYGYVVECTGADTSDDGEVQRVHARLVPGSRGGEAPDGVRVDGTIHWVSVAHAVDLEVRLYDRLFVEEVPGAAEGRDPLDDLNPDSLVVVTAKAEPALAGLPAGAHVQLERHGYFYSDPADSRPGGPVLNRVVGLRDGWSRKSAAPSSRPAAKPRARAAAPTAPATNPRDAIRAADAELAERFTRYREAWGVGENEADVLTGDRAVADFFEATHEAGAAAPTAARWIVHEVLREAGVGPLSALPFGPAALAALVELVDSGRVTAAAGKQILGIMASDGGEPTAIMAARGLEKVDDDGAVAAIVAEVVARHPDEVARYRGGEQRLLGFFMGQAMRAAGGRAAADAVRAALVAALGDA